MNRGDLKNQRRMRMASVLPFHRNRKF